MDFDVAGVAGLETRELASEMRDGRLARVVVASRAYRTSIEDLWDAVTNEQRIPRWFAPVTGELQLGGRYQVEGNAGGEVTACEPPRSFAATWEMFGEVSWIEVALAPQDGGATLLTLRHIAHVDDDRWQQFGPGAVGVGWDLGLLGLHLHLTSEWTLDPRQVDEWSTSPAGKEYVRLCSEDWGRASIAGGTDPAEAASAVANTTAFYTGDGGEPGHDH